MEYFYDFATVFADSAGFALAVSLAISVPIYIVLRMIPAISRFRPFSTWDGDTKSVGVFATVHFRSRFSSESFDRFSILNYVRHGRYH